MFQLIDLGDGPNTNTGDSARLAGSKINSNFEYFDINTVKKYFSLGYAFNSGTNNAEYSLPENGESFLSLTSSGLISVSGFNLSLVTGAVDGPYPNKLFYVLNNTGNPITLNDNDDTNAEIPFLLKDGANIVMPNNEWIIFSYSSTGLTEMFKSWIDADGVNGLPELLAEKADISYVDSLVVGLWDDRGSFDASVNAYPSSGGSGASGAIKKGDIWTISVAGTLPAGQVVEIGDTVRALIDAPDNAQSNWSIQQNNIGYVPENVVNKATTMVGNTTSNLIYLSAKAIYDWGIGFFQPILTDLNFGSFINGLTSKTTPVDADQIGLMDSADGNKQKKVSLTNFKAFLRTYFDTLYASKFRIGSAVDTSTVTGTTTITLVMTPVLIPANTFLTGDAFTFRARLRRTVSTSSNSTIYFYVAPNSSVTVITDPSLIQISFYTASLTNTLIQGKSEIVVKNNTTATTLVNYTASDDDIIGTDFRSRTIDWTVDNWVYLFIGNAQTTTSAYVSFWELFKK